MRDERNLKKTALGDERNLKKTALGDERNLKKTALGDERNLKKTALELLSKAKTRTKIEMAEIVQDRIVEAAHTLRHLPDRERSFLQLRGSAWPEHYEASYGKSAPSEKNKRVRPDPEVIDRMQPALDLLLLLPDVADRQLVFWVAWHCDGEALDRIPWAKVRRSLNVSQSRWTMKRHHAAALRWLGAVVLLQT